MDEKKPKEAPPKERDKEKEEAKKGAGPDTKAPKNNKMLLMGIIAGVIAIEIIAGIVVVKMVMPKQAMEMESEAPEDTTAHHDEEAMTAMGATTVETPVEVVVNIAGTDGERFLKAAVVLEYEEKGEVKKGGEGGEGEGKKALSPMAEAINQRIPKFKSYLIEYLSKMTITEVTAPDAKEKIRKDFMRLVNSTLPSELGEVRDIYFTQYIIQ
jgi:flagellar basal body-associated protein FliL